MLPHLTWRRVYLAPLALVSAAVLAACGSAGSTSSAGASSGNGSGSHHYTIGVSFYTNTIPLYIQMAQGMKQEAAKEGITLDFSYANNDAQEQTSQIEDFVTKHVDMILCSPVSAAALVPAYQQAKEAGIPIISVANKVTDQYENAFIGKNWSFVGQAQVDYVAQALHSSGQIAIIQGPPAIDFVNEESQGWTNELKKYPGLHVVATEVDPDLSESQGLSLANDILTAHPNVKAIIATDDDIAMGVAQALQQQGMKAGKVLVTGLDGEPRVINEIKDQGYVQFTISVKGLTWGVQAVMVASNWLNGQKPSSPTIPSAYQIINPQDVAKLTQADLS